MSDLSQETVDAITAALFAGNKIEAIKLYRSASGQGLKESKDFVEAIELRLREQSPEKFSKPAGSGCMGVALVAIVVGVGAAIVAVF